MFVSREEKYPKQEELLNKEEVVEQIARPVADALFMFIKSQQNETKGKGNES